MHLQLFQQCGAEKLIGGKFVVSSQGFRTSYSSRLNLFSRTGDAVLVGLLLFVVANIYSVKWSEQYSLVLAIGVGLFLFVAGIQRLYVDSSVVSIDKRAIKICYIWLIVVALILLLGSATKTSADYSRLTHFTWFLITPLILVLWHARGARVSTATTTAGGHNQRADNGD